MITTKHQLIMNAIKRFFIHFRKHGSISRVPDKKDKCVSNAENCSTEGVKITLIEDDKHVENKEETSKVLGQKNRDSMENSEGIKEDKKEEKGTENNPCPQDLSESIAEISAADSTTECLKEFDDILKDVSKDITDACDSLDDIEDVLNNINEEDSKASLFETPRFDLQDLMQNFVSVNLADNIIDNDPNDTTLTEVMDVDEIDEPNELVIDDTKQFNAMEYDFEKDIDVDVAEVISISSEDSLPPNNFKLDGKLYEQNVRMIHVPKDAKDEKNEPTKVVDKKEDANDEPQNVNLVNDEPIIVDDDEIEDFIAKPQSMDVELKDVKNKIKELNDEATKNIETVITNENDELIIVDEVKGFTVKPESINVELKDVEIKNKELNAEATRNIETIITNENDEQIIVDQVAGFTVKPESMNVEPKDMKKKNESINDKPTTNTKVNLANENDEVYLKSKNSPSIDSDDCGYQSSDFEFITEEEAKMDGLIINVNPSLLKPKFKKPKRVKTIEIGIDQFSGRRNPKRINSTQNTPESNRFTSEPSLNNIAIKQGDKNEFKANSNLQVDTSIQNNTRSALRNVRRLRDHLSMVADVTTEENDQETLKDTIMNCTQSNDVLEITYTRPYMPEISNLEKMQVDCPGIITDSSTKLSELNCSGSNLFGPTLLENRPTILGPGPSFQENNTGYEPSYSQRYHPDVSHSLLNSLENNNIPINLGPSQSIQENGFAFRPSNLGNSSGFKNLQGTSNSPKSHQNYEKWRELRNRNQNQFILDQSYRDNHRMLENEEYYRLFDPNIRPLPNQGMRLMENKSIRSKNMMLVEYEGVGFDMQMMREWSETEDEVKEEADASARKILDMYPGQNRKRRRRF